jgi:hypothetical protein
VIDECIHGLELARCDVCSPKLVQAPTVVAPARTRLVKTSLTTTPRVSPRRTSAADSRPAVDIGEQRIYHVTHVSNLEGILARRKILAAGNGAWNGEPPMDISSGGNRAARRDMAVAGAGTPAIADYVPFFLSPNSTVWEGVRAGTPDGRIFDAALTVAPADFVILVSTVKSAMGLYDGAFNVVVTDGDAVGPLTRFGSSADTFERMLRRLVADKESDVTLGAEFLVREAFPVELVTLIGVANDRARGAVRTALEGSSHQPRVALYPPWFVRPE